MGAFTNGLAVLAVLLPLAACADHAALPPSLAGKVAVIDPGDPSHDRANVAAAVKPEGQGGVSQALVVRLTQDMPVYRMWNGPVTTGNSNRMGGWWAFDAPRGTREGYRRAYEICGTWNQLVWVAKCTLRQGAVVAIGPGQSVSAQLCGDASGYERYDANPRDWQVYVHQAWTRGDELACPPETADYRADPANVAQPLP
jgi:hypothetical protein